MPVRKYRCPEGHSFDVLEPMDSPAERECIRCDLKATRQWAAPGRPKIKGGTPIHHGSR